MCDYLQNGENVSRAPIDRGPQGVCVDASETGFAEKALTGSSGDSCFLNGFYFVLIPRQEANTKDVEIARGYLSKQV